VYAIRKRYAFHNADATGAVFPCAEGEVARAARNTLNPVCAGHHTQSLRPSYLLACTWEWVVAPFDSNRMFSLWKRVPPIPWAPFANGILVTSVQPYLDRTCMAAPSL